MYANPHVRFRDSALTEQALSCHKQIARQLRR